MINVSMMKMQLERGRCCMLLSRSTCTISANIIVHCKRLQECVKSIFKDDKNVLKPGFSVIWFVKCMKIRKLKIEIISIQHNSFIYSIHCRVSPLSYTRSTKLFALNLVTHLHNLFIVTKRISDRHHFCK